MRLYKNEHVPAEKHTLINFKLNYSSKKKQIRVYLIEKHQTRADDAKGESIRH